MSKIVLIDGHSILNRAFYGVPELTNSEGLHTNAIYGFLNIMFHILEEEQPEYLTVAFDVSAKTFRHEIYEAYKGTRKAMPEELREQVPVMKEVLRSMGVRLIEQAGLEADDLLGTIAKKAEAEGLEVSLVSGDRDLLQIASDHIKIRIPKTKGNRTEVEDYYAADVERVYQVDPIGFIDLKALMGDTSDNIPGVPKVGQKTATDLMVRFGSLDNIYAHVDEIEKKSIRESLIEHKDLADLSKVLATINVNAEFPYELEEARLGNLFTADAYAYLKKLEFKNFLSRFAQGEKKTENVKQTLIELENRTALQQAMEACRKQKMVAVSYLYLPVDDSVLRSSADGQLAFDFSEKKERLILLFSCDGEKIHIADSEKMQIPASEIGSELARLCGKDEKTVISAYECKNLYRLLDIEPYRTATEVGQHFFDIKIAAYLLNPLKSDYAKEDIASEYCKMDMQGYQELFGKLSAREAWEQKKEAYIAYLMNEAAVAYRAYGSLSEKLENTEMDRLFYEMEMPLSYVLFRMEKEGIRLKPEELKHYGDTLAERMQVLEQEIYSQAGREFNINSPKQLGEVLFDEMKLPGGKKTKTGYSTAADVLEKLAVDHPFVKDVLEYRGLAKLKSTYADGLVCYVDDNNRIHTTFHQTITATGRISSTEPNLQNIPMRMELGRLIRKVFVPKDGYLFMDADYSQIELRILAHMSGDPELIDAYKQNQDIHRITASKVFHTPFDEVTDLQRRNAKAVNFGIVYGISSFGLSQDLSISRKEAAEYIEQYFATYPGVKRYLDQAVADAKEHGYSVTMYGRRRPVPELKSSNFMQRQFGERVAMNAPIQGTAADIMKIAMIRVFDRLKEERLRSELILQIHDELLIETDPAEEDTVRAILQGEMEHAASLLVDLAVDLHTGTDWYEAK